MNISQVDYNVLKQPFINKYIKLNILDFEYNTVYEISGNVTSCSVSVDADSDLRRSCSISMVVTNSNFDIKSGSPIWLDKFIQPFIGYYNIQTQEIQWYNQGIYLINQPTWEYNPVSNTLSFQGLDLMSKLTGLRNGNLEGIPTVIEQGENVREVIIATLEEAGFTKYIVAECENSDGTIQEIPYEIQINQGGTVYNILSELRDILPQYQIYFDIDGVFHYDLIPSGDDDPVLIDDDLWNNILASENINTDFESVKNVIEIYGKTHDVSYYSTETTVSNGVISLTIPDFTSAVTEEYTLIGFTLPTSITNTNVSIDINEFGAENLVNYNGDRITDLEADVYYCANYQSNGTWLFLGHQQAQAVIEDTNINSPFYVNGTVGRIRIALYGGDYDNITSDDLAMERAKLELYWRCRLNDSITLNCVPIPWLDVNIIISHSLKGGTEQKKYMIKSFSMNYGENAGMTINAITYYPYYEI